MVSRLPRIFRFDYRTNWQNLIPFFNVRFLVISARSPATRLPRQGRLKRDGGILQQSCDNLYLGDEGNDHTEFQMIVFAAKPPTVVRS